MAAKPKYVTYEGPTTSKQTVVTTSSPDIEKPPFKLNPIVIWIVTIVIVIIILIIVFLSIRSTSEPEIINEPAEPGIIDLGSLIDLAIVGECCVPPDQLNGILTYIYDPVSNYTYSFNPTPPNIVCQTLTGSNLTQCTNLVSNADGSPRILAHFGIRYYYAFSPGKPVALCPTFSPVCPPFN